MTEAEQYLYQTALRFAAEKHKGQFRIGGQPYITHPVSVAEIVRSRGYDIRYQLTALFHDLLEDTDATEQEIEALGGTEVLTAVRLLSKKPGYRMNEYVSAIRGNDMAFVVKGADRLHNLRCAVHANQDFQRRYLAETLEWYLDFDPEIQTAVNQLKQSLTASAD